jgi:RNA polymerase sigma-70 factor (ECF subfamily)
VDYSTISAEELALTCFRSGNELAWAEFVRRFQPLIAGVVFRVARKWGETSAQVVDDLVQDTYLKLCAESAYLSGNFRATHKDAIYGYIKVFAANLAQDHFKAHRSEKRGGLAAVSSIDRDDRCQSTADSKSAESAIERNILIQQIDACLKTVLVGPHTERDRRIFWLYYRVGLAASAIARMPTIALTTKGVESTLLRLTREVRHRLVMSRPGIVLKDKSTQGVGPEESFC